MTELRSWLQFSMMWDAIRDPVALVSEFAAAFYGPIHVAGPRVLQHIIEVWEKSVEQLGATLTTAEWRVIEGFGGFVECECSDGHGHPWQAQARRLCSEGVGGAGATCQLCSCAHRRTEGAGTRQFQCGVLHTHGTRAAFQLVGHPDAMGRMLRVCHCCRD